MRAERTMLWNELLAQSLSFWQALAPSIYLGLCWLLEVPWLVGIETVFLIDLLKLAQVFIHEYNK